MTAKVVAWRDSRADTPRGADIGVGTLRALLEFGRLRGRVTFNAAANIPTLYRNGQRAAIIWTDEEMERFAETAKRLERPHVIDGMRLAALTGLRRADLVTLDWSHVGDTAIRKLALKSSRRTRQYVTVPIIADLRSLLDELRDRPRKDGVTTVLVNSHGAPWSGDGFGGTFNRVRDEADIVHIDEDSRERKRKHLHDIRGTFCTKLLTEAALSDEEAAGIMGWSVAQVASIRRIYVDQSSLISSIAQRMMQTHPERSIGIVAMNAKQTELIQNEFDRLIVEEERVRKYVEAFEGTIDEFFIKNLENVQGDERDIILISTVYGPDKNGVVRQNFGLMNREVGWRRLNVLVTRAKISCRLITSLRPDDVKVTEKSSKGVIAFKSYLTYAHGGATYDPGTGGETDSDFEIFVAEALRGAGYEVIYQVGVEGFRIDLGVRHESCPIGFIAGIECDGAPYHSGLSVRDRDHIRQTILENLGWNIYRVWSTDWFADPSRETSKLIAWVDRVREQISSTLIEQTAPIEVRRPKQKESSTPAVPDQTDDLASTTSITDPVSDNTDVIAEIEGPREPRGRMLRSIGDFETYEAIRGRLYEIWRDQELLGEVEVVKRATAAPKLFGDRAMAAQSEYEGRVEATGDSFRSFDLYAAMREVAVRATP